MICVLTTVKVTCLSGSSLSVIPTLLLAIFESLLLKMWSSSVIIDTWKKQPNYRSVVNIHRTFSDVKDITVRDIFNTNLIWHYLLEGGSISTCDESNSLYAICSMEYNSCWLNMFFLLSMTAHMGTDLYQNKSNYIIRR